MLFDILDNGVTNESLSRAFKVGPGLSEFEYVIELSGFFRGETLVEVNEAARSLMDKFPVFSERRDEFGFSERCKVTNVQNDGFLEELEQLRDPSIPQLPPLLAKHNMWPIRRIASYPEIRNRFS